MKDEFNETRVMEAAEYARTKMTEFLKVGDLPPSPSNPAGSHYVGGFFKGCPVYKDITNAETELAIIRALGLMVMDGTQRMFRFQIEETTDDN